MTESPDDLEAVDERDQADEPEDDPDDPYFRGLVEIEPREQPPDLVIG